ncbi:MAG TPA: threonine/serine exporter family protein [Candidatus Merdenecus merdavium]|nr:threonine/serine exporter family protein [Candidatus Merdenecus merdavium]
MNHKLLMETATLAGEIMLVNGAEIYRVEDTINRILSTAHLETTEAFVMSTGIVATLDGMGHENITIVKRITQRGMNLNRVATVNTISRKYCNDEISLEEANKQLKSINGNQFHPVVRSLSVLVIVSSFALLLGGGVWEVLGAGLTGLLLILSMNIGNKIGAIPFLQDLFSSAVIAIGAVLLKRYLPIELNMDLVIIGCIMPLVPGAAITNAIRDTLQGDYMAGLAKMLEAFVNAASIALGVGIGIAIMGGV